jgi:hypothetical protein
LVPVAEEFVIAGAAAHITADTQTQLEEFVAIQRELWAIDYPDGDIETFARTQSARLNHFVMALPREERISQLDDLMLKGRVALQMAKGSLLGTSFSGDDDEESDDFEESDDSESADDSAHDESDADDSVADDTDVESSDSETQDEV